MKRYIFQYAAEPTRTGIIYRPKAKILLQSAESDWYSFGVYVDSGADLSLFTKTDAKLLGLNLYHAEYRPIIGIGKILIPAYTHKVKMKIEETTLNVNVAFADSDEVPRLLGRTDIFIRFKITFDEQKLQTIFETDENAAPYK